VEGEQPGFKMRSKIVPLKKKKRTLVASKRTIIPKWMKAGLLMDLALNLLN